MSTPASISTQAPLSAFLSQPDYPRVLVTGVGGPSGRAATAALQERDFFVLGVDMNSVPNCANQFEQVPASLSASYPDMLRSLISEHNIDWLFPTVAEELVIVAGLADELREQGVSVFISGAAAVGVCEDKWMTAQTLAASDIAVPESAVGCAEDVSVRNLGFPLVSRPRNGRGGRGVVVHDGPGVQPAVAEPVWQKFISGTEYDVLLVRHPDPPQHVVMCQVFEKVLLKDGRVGNATEVKAVEMFDVAALAEDAACALGLTGPLDMDIRRGQDGGLRLLEINARIGAHSLNAPALFDVLVDLVRQGHRG